MHGMVWAGWSGAVSAQQFSWIFCVSAVSFICCLVVGAGLIWVSAPLFFVLAHGDFLECMERGLLCAREGYRVLAQGVGGGVFARGDLVSTIGWWVGGTVSAWGSLGVVVWTQLCFDWFALSSVRGDFCVSVRGFLVWA